MRILTHLVVVALVSGSLFCLSPAVASPGANGGAPAAHPKPARDIKIWTNEDLSTLGPRLETASEPVQSEAASTEAAAVASETPAVSFAPEKDPKWYATQLDMLEAELGRLTDQEEQLRQFRATSQGLPTGLNISAPCEGMTTDNRIAQLDARRLEIAQEIDALGDTARANGMSPGVLVEGRGRVNVETELAPEERRQALIDRYRDVSAELAATQDTVASVNDYATSQNVSLIQPDARWGGNMTTNMLQSLRDRRASLSADSASLEDDARLEGVAPGALR